MGKNLIKSRNRERKIPNVPMKVRISVVEGE
jgi:hypothetical protein